MLSTVAGPLGAILYVLAVPVTVAVLKKITPKLSDMKH